MARLCGFDLETPQDEPSWGLQPWRARSGEATVKSCALWTDDVDCCKKAVPDIEWFREVLVNAASDSVTLVGWNLLVFRRRSP